MHEGQDSGGTAVATDQPAQSEILNDPRFTGSASYEMDEPKKEEAAPEQPLSDRPRNERGQFTEKPKEDGKEAKAVKLPESIKPPKPRDEKDINGRFLDLSRSHEELRREYRRIQEEVQQLRNGGQKQEPQKPGQAQEKPVSRLKPEDFKTWEEYDAAAANDVYEQRKQQELEQQKAQAIDHYYAEKRSEFEGHAKAIIEAVPDFWEVISNPQVPMTNPMANAVIELGEMGPVTALYLATNPNEAFAIAKMSPLQGTIAIGKIAARLEQEFKQANEAPAPAQPNTPQAPRPRAVPDVRGGSPGDSLDDRPKDTDPIDVWERKEAARMRKQDPRAKFWSRF